MLKKNFFLILFLVLVISIIPVFVNGEEENQSKKYDLMFSLAGGNIGEKFTLTGNFLYAQELEDVFFVQAAGFADINGQKKEYGGSFGFGLNSNESFSFYLFADSLYSYEKLWMQLRPTVRLRLSWLGLTGFYAFPLTKSVIQIDNEDVVAAKYFGGEAEIVPVKWARIYGNLMSVESAYTRYSVGAEVRLFKYVSLSADYNKTDAGIYSNSYKGFRVALNILFGAQQQSFEPTYRKIVAPMYPILGIKKEEPEPPGPPGREVEFKYVRVGPVTDPNKSDVTNTALSIFHNNGGKSAPRWTKAEDGWVTSVYLKSRAGYYYVWTYDYQMTGTSQAVARRLFARVKGSTEWIELVDIVANPCFVGEEAARFLFHHGRIIVKN